MLDTWLYFGLFPFVVFTCVAYVCDLVGWDKISYEKQTAIVPRYAQVFYITSCFLAFIAVLVFLIGATIALNGKHDLALLAIQCVLGFEVWCAIGLWLSHAYYQKAKQNG